MLDSLMAGRIDSKPIRLGYAMFKNNRYAILPVKTLAGNIGLDGTGVYNLAGEDRFLVKIEENLPAAKFENIEMDPQIKKAFVAVFKASAIPKFKRMLRYGRE